MKRLLTASVVALTMTSCAATQAQPDETDEPRASRSATREPIAESAASDEPDWERLTASFEDGIPKGEPVPCDGRPVPAHIGAGWSEAVLSPRPAGVLVHLPARWEPGPEGALLVKGNAVVAGVTVQGGDGGGVPDTADREWRMAELGTFFQEVRIAERIDEATCLIAGVVGEGFEFYVLLHVPEDAPPIVVTGSHTPGADDEAHEVLQIMRSVEFSS